MLGTLASRVTGLLRNSLLVQLFDSGVTDAFNVAVRLPNLFRELLAEGALTNSFIPAYKTLPPREAKRLSSALFSLLLVVNAFLLGVAVWAAPVVVGFLLAENSTVDRALTITLTRAVFPFLGAISFAALAMGILNAEERFFAPAWAPVVLNVVTTALMLLYPQQAPMLAVAFVLGGVAQLVFQLPPLARAGLLPRLGVWWHPQLRSVLVLMVPFTFTTGARQFLNVVSSRLLTGLPAGSVTAFSNADLFLGLALGLFSISPALAFYSRLAAQIGSPREFRTTLLTGLRLIAFLTVPAGLLLTFYAEPAVVGVFTWLPLLGGGGMDGTTLALSVSALTPLGLAVFPVGLSTLLLRTFYVRRSVRVPVLVSVCAVALNVPLYILLARLGVAGLSWATVMVGWAQLGALLYLVGRREHLSLRELARDFGRVWLAALLGVVPTWGLVGALPLPEGWWGAVGTLLLGGGGGVVFYLVLCARLGVPEAARLWRR
ncbi:MAG: Proposed peptidoglycan lipid II flippase MurJ [uncultured Truepera sp.]|uniref:Proposed peptidoglycan lipid II flippase MurJ n=1 Tax=uncultured Truepera sp. TaxID=543023 RepID=A0A6J4UZ87_9DEIN|nr:MAG: Proposed peptidoglycan lipid II flippase MurJ [uncultured Truepera sp.]